MLAAEEPVPGNGRKRLRTDDEEEEDDNGNKKRRIHEDKAGPMDLDEQNGNQDSEVADEKEDENQENNNGEEDKKEQETEEGKTEEGKTEGSGNNANHQNSEQNGSGNQESGGDEGDENGKNDENQEENDNNEEEDGENDENQEEEEEDEEERRRRAAEKGKRPMICNLEPIEPEFSEEIKYGEPSNISFEDQTYGDNDDFRDLAILKSLWNYKYNSGNISNPPSDKLLKYVMDSISHYKLIKEYLKLKIMEFEFNFKDLIQMDGDNPELRRPIHRETFELCKRLWGNLQQPQTGTHQQRRGGNQQQPVRVNLQQRRLRADQQQRRRAHFYLIYYQEGDDLTIYLIIMR